MEQRQLQTDFEVRESANGEMTIAGYAIKFNSESRDLGGFTEVVEPTALNQSLRENDIKLLYAHDRNAILGRTSSGTLQLRQDNVGLHFEATLPPTQLGKDTYTMIKRGDLKGMSFGFNVREDDWNFKGDTAKRYLQDINLSEISIVGDPAYLETTVNARAFEKAKESNQKLLEIEAYFNAKKGE